MRRQTRKNSVESKTKKHGESVKRVIYQCRTRPAGGRGPHATGTCSEYVSSSLERAVRRWLSITSADTK